MRNGSYGVTSSLHGIHSFFSSKDVEDGLFFFKRKDFPVLVELVDKSFIELGSVQVFVIDKRSSKGPNHGKYKDVLDKSWSRLVPLPRPYQACQRLSL